MRTWKLRPTDPLCLTLAADARLATLDYANDQIWELLPGTGEPPAVVIQTTYGLRARSMRIFPQFAESHQIRSNPAEFDSPLLLTHFAPNYLRFTCAPFPGIQAVLEYWAPASQTLAGRIQISNPSELDRRIRLELAAVLNPDSDGKPLAPRKKEATMVLEGATGGIEPVLFITGGAEGVSSPYPTLFHDMRLEPGSSRRFTWVLVSLNDANDSFRQARLTAAQNWDAEIARIEMVNSQQIEVTTGDPGWDAALAFSQKTAFNLLHSANANLPYTSFVSTRLPDQGYSPKGSGREYNHLWSGQTALETWYLAQYFLPGNAEIAKGLLRNFIRHQQENGSIDHKPGLGGQHSGLTATPLLVSTAWQIYQYTQDRAFLQEVFRPLLAFTQAWFSEENDRDGDGIPEWANLIQSGYDENPAFSRWLTWGQGAEISLVESPDLCAFLYREVTLLLKMAEIIGRKEPIPALQAMADNLHRAVQSSWNGHRATYQYWDRETHLTSKGETIQQRSGSGEMLLDLVFELPVRVLLRLECRDTTRPQVIISVHGHTASGQHRVERITPDSLNWQEGVCSITLPNLYAELEHLHIDGLPPTGQVSLQIVDLYQEDQTLLVPLWAQIADHKQAEAILTRKLEKPNYYGHPFGIPAYPKPPSKDAEDTCYLSWLPWNKMIAEGLLAYGMRAAATNLFTHLMDAVVPSLEREHAFRAHYHTLLPQSAGQRNHLIGLPPIGLFLDILGIRPLSPWKVEIAAKNPFPWPVTIKFKGLLVSATAENVQIKFPDGETFLVAEQIPCLVEHSPAKQNKEEEQ